jgi:X-Pro dipeptidyl-peptidase
VTVTDSGPTIIVPGQQTVEASDASGSNVNFVPAPTANDVQEGTLVPVCSRASGSKFPIGSTTVTCTATDAGGASAAASFVVVVRK